MHFRRLLVSVALTVAVLALLGVASVPSAQAASQRHCNYLVPMCYKTQQVHWAINGKELGAAPLYRARAAANNGPLKVDFKANITSNVAVKVSGDITFKGAFSKAEITGKLGLDRTDTQIRFGEITVKDYPLPAGRIAIFECHGIYRVHEVTAYRPVMGNDNDTLIGAAYVLSLAEGENVSCAVREH